MRKVILGLAFAAAAGCGAVSEVQSGDRVAIGEETYILVRESDWAGWTNRVGRLEVIAQDRWEQTHKTEAGRTLMHGKRTSTVITNGMVYAVYADGYNHGEAIANQSRRPREATGAKREAAKIVKDAAPNLYAEIMAKRKRALSTTNEVTATIVR